MDSSTIVEPLRTANSDRVVSLIVSEVFDGSYDRDFLGRILKTTLSIEPPFCQIAVGPHMSNKHPLNTCTLMQRDKSLDIDPSNAGNADYQCVSARYGHKTASWMAVDCCSPALNTNFWV